MNKFTGWLATLACASLLAACGGGGGSPGTNSNGVAPSRAASVTLTADATTIASSGLDGTEVTLTAIVKDSGGNALVGETVSFSASSGTITSTNRVTNTSGQVVEKLSVKGDSSLRTITITASAGNAKSNVVTVQVVNAVPTLTLTLTADSGTLPSGGTKNVTVTALVRDANNNVVPNVAVSLKSDSGSLSVTNAMTNAQGLVTGTLGIGGDATSRDIKVSASVTGATATPIVVRVSGNVLTISAAPSISAGSSTDVTVKLVDSAGNPLIGKPVTYSSNANSLTVKGGGSAVTNSSGQLVLGYAASGGTADVISVKAMGELASAGIAINSSTFAVRVLDGSGNVESSAAIGGCQQVAVTNAPGSSVTVTSSRGTVYSDNGCTAVQSGALGLANGAATAYVNATGPGVATLTASAGGQTTQTALEFYAPLTSTSTITLQVDPANIGTNTSGSTSEQATLRAVVRDGTAQNNLVKNAAVAFSIVSDPSGGKLTEPSSVTTGIDGAASTSFIAGSSVTPTDGVRIQARLVEGSNAAAIATLTVAQKSLFISAGTGNTVLTPDSTTYQMDYAVIVSDAAGNAVSGVKLTASVLPTFYYKGTLGYTLPTGPWEPVSRTACANEDLNNNGILDAGEDINGNGVLDPGIPVTVTPNVTTDSTGRATVSLVYPRDRVYWLDVNLTIRGQASGTESRYTSLVHLIGLSGDYSSQNVRPPGATSPYGVSTTCSNPQ
ncbi:Ig-like group 1 domain-containing protein [Duganella sp. FT134W]|uniref:Ig-like group 1 domain-containing protein n=1 Tax=Duganella margarita TaxID=2692170 RepID=A0A7X4GZP5_9BURK|nr:Ig-like domain-containing protein [Duganella margarita]MYM72585.1 Ig-like group 1 domain-containing protein [Duganella margarita]